MLFGFSHIVPRPPREQPCANAAAPLSCNPQHGTKSQPGKSSAPSPMRKAMQPRHTLALLAFLLATFPVAAQEWPTKPTKIVVPFGPGSTPDVVARLIADHLQKKLGQPFLIETSRGRAVTLVPTRSPKPSPTVRPSGSALAARSRSIACCSRSSPTTPRPTSPRSRNS
jgi:hypothetical protein